MKLKHQVPMGHDALLRNLATGRMKSSISEADCEQLVTHMSKLHKDRTASSAK